jgi:predicted metal-dependent enzyme (double-stranded beta helix superfamily)
MRFLLLIAAVSLAFADDRIALDNDFVRILNVIEQPHQKTPLHEHELNRVIVYLDAGEMRVDYPGGRSETSHYKARQVNWSLAGGMHVTENIGVKPIHIVEVELKKAAPKMPSHRAPELDPVVIDPKHNNLLLENDQVRVFRSWREPGASEMMHAHEGAGRVAVFLTEVHASVKSADGAIDKLDAPAGEARWSGPATHMATNTGPRRFDMIIVEVK